MNDYLLSVPSGKWIMREHALFHINAVRPLCTLFFHVFMHAYCASCTCVRVFACACVWECASMCSGDSLIPEVAWIGEGLQLDGWLWDSLSSLGLNDSPIDVLLQVDKAPVVAHRLPGWDVCVLHKIGVPDSVGAHDVVHVHADSVADFGRQGGCRGGRPGLALPGWVLVLGELKDDTLKDRLHHLTTHSF